MFYTQINHNPLRCQFSAAVDSYVVLNFAELNYNKYNGIDIGGYRRSTHQFQKAIWHIKVFKQKIVGWRSSVFSSAYYTELITERFIKVMVT